MRLFVIFGRRRSSVEADDDENVAQVKEKVSR